jgi:hypothetical protein
VSAQLVRSLTSHGIDRFRSYLAALRDGATLPPPKDLLHGTEYSEPLSQPVHVSHRHFRNRLELAAYFTEVLDPLPLEAVDTNLGLWSWLSLFYFDQVCPLDARGGRRPGRDYRHIPDLNRLFRHRHLVYGPFRVYRLHGEHATLLLSGRPDVEHKIYHEIAARQDLIVNPGVVDAATQLYYDPRTSGPKRAAYATRPSPGTVLRFINVLQQLDVTFDVHGMTGPQILELLPPEFNEWKGTPPGEVH